MPEIDRPKPGLADEPVVVRRVSWPRVLLLAVCILACAVGVQGPLLWVAAALFVAALVGWVALKVVQYLLPPSIERR